MAISQGGCNSFKVELFNGIHQAAHEYKIALFTSEATLSKSTTTYTDQSHEIANGNGYETGGLVLSGREVSLVNDTAVLDFADPSWTDATFTARGALIYNNTLDGKNSLCVIDFGQDFSCSNGTFTVRLPLPGEATALVRIL